MKKKTDIVTGWEKQLMAEGKRDDEVLKNAEKEVEHWKDKSYLKAIRKNTKKAVA